MFNLLYAKVKNVVVKVLGEKSKTVRLDIESVASEKNVLSEIGLITPYGHGSVPPKGINIIVTPVNNSAKKLFGIGVVDGIPPIKDSPKEGEAWLRSLGYLLLNKNDAVKVYRIDDDDFYPTLPNGEAFVATMLNRIAELEDMISTLNDNYNSLKSTFNNHEHPNGNLGLPTGVPSSQLSQTNITMYNTLDKDKQYLQGGKALIDDSGEMYS